MYSVSWGRPGPVCFPACRAFPLPIFRRRSSMASFLTLRSERSRNSHPVHASPWLPLAGSWYWLLLVSSPGDGSTLYPVPPDVMPCTYSHSWHASRSIRRTTHLIGPFFLPAFRRRSSMTSFLTLRSERSRKSNPVHAFPWLPFAGSWYWLLAVPAFCCL